MALIQNQNPTSSNIPLTLRGIRRLGLCPPRIVHGKRGITADTALRLGRFFDMEAHFWMNLQTRFDLETVRETLADRLNDEVQVLPV